MKQTGYIAMFILVIAIVIAATCHHGRRHAPGAVRPLTEATATQVLAEARASQQTTCVLYYSQRDSQSPVMKAALNDLSGKHPNTLFYSIEMTDANWKKDCPGGNRLFIFRADSQGSLHLLSSVDLEQQAPQDFQATVSELLDGLESHPLSELGNAPANCKTVTSRKDFAQAYNNHVPFLELYYRSDSLVSLLQKDVFETLSNQYAGQVTFLEVNLTARPDLCLGGLDHQLPIPLPFIDSTSWWKDRGQNGYQTVGYKDTAELKAIIDKQLKLTQELYPGSE